MSNNPYDAQVIWGKYYCPVCKEPTGQGSRCYELKAQKIIFDKGVILPIYSKSCVYRQSNMWIVNFNYPVTEKLLERLQQVPGIEKIQPLKMYSVQISIGLAFDESETKKKFNIAFRGYVAEKSIKNSTPPIINESITIYFPNGNIVKSTDKNYNVIEEISERLPNIKSSRELGL